jgi:hypothetical protein
VIGDYNSFLLIIISYLARASSIAGKYATFPANKIRALKKRKQTYKEIEAELMLIGWFMQKPYVVENEISNTMRRQALDDTLFKIAFMTPISKRAEKELEVIKESHPEYYADHTLKEYRQCSNEGKEIWYYDAKAIFEFLVKEFNKKDRTFTKPKLLIFITLSMAYGISPGIFRALVA